MSPSSPSSPSMSPSMSPPLSSDDGQAEQSSSSDATANTGSTITSQNTANRNANETQGPATSLGGDASAPLSAGQIFAVLQQQPDALVELKSVMADMAQQQGTPVQADSITDQMLYSKIASSPELRANITVFLRARGYVTDAGLESSAASDNSDDLFTSSQSAQVSGQQMPAANLPFNNPLNDDGTPNADLTGAETMPSVTPRSADNSHSNGKNNAMNGPQVLRRPAPYNMLSLRDLYTQLPQPDGKLKRFGSDVFLRRNGYATNQIAPNGRGIPLDVPAGPDYVVGPGDTLTVALWGGISQSLTRTIDRDGKLNLPDAGPVQVAGLSLERVQGIITSALKKQYRDVQVAVTVARLRSIRVYVVGDVQRPGAFDISSLSTPLNALFAAGGPTSIGSLRTLRHYRGTRLVEEIDLYDFLLHGVQNEDRLQSGDTLAVPP
ncbi:MAG: hypothetical protein QOJ42_2909, partial [Acidobacteriaceae bacterium]|nr:hypothetical protein [Acidobacteriaceae bacterium]